MNKKALSPLSSTLLLLAVSIVIGIIVMSWGRAYVEKATNSAEQKEMSQKQASLLDELNTRLQSGEITKDQYDKLKSVLVTS